MKVVIPFALLGLFVLATHTSAADTVKSIEDKATHQQSTTIKMEKGAPTINAFCLNADGLIVAACGNGPGELRIIDATGKVQTKWEVQVKPEAVSVRSDGSILVAGEGKVFQFSPEGKKIASVASPHAEKLHNADEELRKTAIESLKRTSGRGSLTARISSYENIIEQLEKRAEEKELTTSEKQLLQRLPDTLEVFKKQLETMGEEEDEDDEPTEEAIARQVDILIKSKMRISSICSSNENVFITTRALTGYGYDIWKTDANLEGGEIIVSGLRGCCGQMDVQCCEKGLFVAENSADRVVHYDHSGKEITHWGKSDRTGINGFGSCCNPMNVCFDNEGFVYTAEASLGRIKKFDAAGELIGYVGDVDLVPGCKNVSIAVSPVNQSVFMLDLTRNHIVMMQPKSSSSVADSPAPNTPVAKTAAVQAKGKENE